jgi:hypothetical protein
MSMFDASARIATATFSDDRYRYPVGTPIYQYIVCDLLTDQLQASLPLTGVTFERRLSRMGDFKAQWRISNRQQAILADQITRSCGKLAIWVLRNKKLWWGGILWSAEGSVSTRSYDQIDLAGATFDSYTYRRDLDYDWNASSSKDITKQIYDLWDAMQDESSKSDIGVLTDIPAVNTSGAAFPQAFLEADLKKYGDVIQAFTDCDPGADYTIDVYADAGARKKRLRAAGSFRSVEVQNRLALSGYRIPAWRFKRDSAGMGTRFQAWGDPQESNVGVAAAPISSPSIFALDKLNDGWPYLDVSENVGAVPSDILKALPVLDNYAAALRAAFSGIRDIVSYEVDLGTSEWHPNLIGQNILIKHSKKDLWKPGQTSVITPVVATFTPPDRGQPEKVAFTIDGAEEED